MWSSYHHRGCEVFAAAWEQPPHRVDSCWECYCEGKLGKLYTTKLHLFYHTEHNACVSPELHSYRTPKRLFQDSCGAVGRHKGESCLDHCRKHVFASLESCHSMERIQGTDERCLAKAWWQRFDWRAVQEEEDALGRIAQPSNKESTPDDKQNSRKCYSSSCDRGS